MVTVVAQLTAEITNSEKAIYDLSLTFCSINKLKSHMLLTCKNVTFYGFTWKNFFLLQEMVAQGGEGVWLAPPCPTFIYGP